MRNEHLIQRLHAALAAEPEINVARFPVHLWFEGEDTVVEGEVETVRAKKLALELIGSAPEVDRIVDRLRVAPAERIRDPRVQDLVYRALAQEPALIQCSIKVLSDQTAPTTTDLPSAPSGHIVIHVEDGVVTLNGQVPSLSHKRLAGVLAWWVPGTRDVINRLAENPPQADSDSEITDGVRLVLEKDPFVNASQIRVTTRKSAVTLDGVVPSQEHARMAESDAWCVFGVARVINRLVATGELAAARTANNADRG